MSNSTLICSSNVRSIPTPPIDKIHRRVNALRAEGREIINLGQAVPGFSPAPEILDAVRKVLDEGWVHVYGPDPGMPGLRRAVAEKLRRDNGIDLDGSSEIVITAGASQAFLLALMTLARPGQRIVMPTPYYFDHAYAVQAFGCEVVEVPLREGKDWRLDPEALLAAVDDDTAAVVLVSPGNPTGATIGRDELEVIAEGLEGTSVALLSDETYEAFVFDGEGVSPASLPRLRDRTVTLGGFGKSHGLTGWRIGYLGAPAHVVTEMMKLQDSMIICAPMVSQVAALQALALPRSLLDERRRCLQRRRDHLRTRVLAFPGLDWRSTPGAFFALPRLAGPWADAPSERQVEEILEATGVVTLPGSAFGPGGEGHLRISFGNVEEETLDEAFDRLEAMIAP